MDRLEASLRSPREAGVAVVAHVVAGYPSRAAFAGVLGQVSEAVDAIAIAVPAEQPLADGTALGRAADDALADGVDLAWVLETLAVHRAHCPALLLCPRAAMPDPDPGPLLRDLGALGLDGLLVPELEPPGEDEERPLAAAADEAGLALVGLVTGETPEERIPARCAAARGLVWVASGLGVAGGALDVDAAAAFLDRVRPLVPVPVCCGVGVRRPDQARRLAPHADGLVLGTALVEAISQGRDPAATIAAFRSAAAAGRDHAASGEVSQCASRSSGSS